MELDIMWKSRIENKVLLRQMGAGLVDTKRVLINNGKIKTFIRVLTGKLQNVTCEFGQTAFPGNHKSLHHACVQEMMIRFLFTLL